MGADEVLAHLDCQISHKRFGVGDFSSVSVTPDALTRHCSP